MNMEKKKKNKTKYIIGIVIASIGLLLIVLLLFLSFVNRIISGWTNNDSVILIFNLLVTVICISMVITVGNYISTNDKNVMFTNNEIYRLFNLLNKNNKICCLEKEMIDDENVSNFNKINKILKKSHFEITISKENLNNYFDSNGTFINIETTFKPDVIEKLRVLYNDVVSKWSIKYEALFARIHSGDLLKRKQFPVFEIIIPFVIGAIGAFVSIYQVLSVDDAKMDPFRDYLILFGFTIVFAICMAVMHGYSKVELLYTSNLKIIEKMEKILGSENSSK